ncbi:phage major capsid protein [Paenibacillus odorifer]|uniref:Phage capsid-like C-terminal domain-containing protein n=1 Tax=Paenibacillus odorifer TaxID=189426 RepID=A0A1R0Y5N3_9BACL|nr:phage major capsid protein [Paenibacillus odorifer]OMD42566.1 hypothetical protein BSK52_07085 [Paenibacillus odorifer]
MLGSFNKQNNDANERLEQIAVRKKEMRSVLQSNAELGKSKLDEIEIELRGLTEEEEEIKQRENRKNLANGINNGTISSRKTGEFTIGGNGRMENQEKITNEQLQQRGASLKDRKPVSFGIEEFTEFRAVTIGSGKLVVPTHTSDTLNQAFNEVSGIVDVVNAIPLTGGESYKKGFIVSNGEGGYTSETGDYASTDPVTDFVTIGKAKITAYSEITDEAYKLPEIMYQDMVRRGIEIALRKKVAKQVILGAGGSNEITGIFNAPDNVIPTSSDLEIAAIDEDTLDKLVFGYGGSEDVEGGTYLFLNKTDLAAFAALRDANGKKFYKISIDQNGNTGTISSEESYSVRYIINSACPALSEVATASDTYCMAYGKPQSYEMPVFSEITVEESRDFKFKSGQICYRGSLWVGGNVASYNGFIRVKKA